MDDRHAGMSAGAGDSQDGVGASRRLAPRGDDWRSAFPPEEYADRIRRVKAEMARREIDTLVVTSPANITYLTGYDSIWYDLAVVTAFVVRADGDGAFFLDSGYHRMLVDITVTAPEIVFHRGKGVRALVGNLGSRGWLEGNVGVERWSRAPAAPTQAEIWGALVEADATVVDGSWTVDRVRLVKSPLEVVCVRRAAVIADAAMAAIRRELRPGMTEIEVQGLAQYTMAKLGGEEPAIRTVVRSGPRAGARHALPSERAIERGELVDIDFSASYRRYHANIDRTFAVGEVDRRWHDLLQRASGSIDAVVAAVKPGESARRICEVADAYIDSVGLRPYVRWINGYDLGIGIPPEWVGHTFLGGGRFEDAVLEPGFVTNYENTFDVVVEDWPGGRGAAYIDTLLVTETGIEVLTATPRGLIEVRS